MALLHESDLILSDDVIETIVDKVQITQTYKLCSFMIIWPKISEFFCTLPKFLNFSVHYTELQ